MSPYGDRHSGNIHAQLQNAGVRAYSVERAANVIKYRPWRIFISETGATAMESEAAGF